MRFLLKGYLISLWVLPLLAIAEVPPQVAPPPAQEPVQAPAPERWSGAAELGAVLTTGNTDTSTLNAKMKMLYEGDTWSQALALEGLKSTDSHRATAERYLGVYKADYKWDERNYWFGVLRAEKDKFSGYRYQVSESVGYGRWVWRAVRGHLKLEIGPGARQSELDDQTRTNDVILRFNTSFRYVVSSSAEWTEDLLIQSGKDNTESELVSALKLKINGSLSAKFANTLKHNSDVPPERDKLDTKTAITLVYDY